MYLTGVRSCIMAPSTNERTTLDPNERMPCGPETPQSSSTVYPSCLITEYRAYTDSKHMRTKTLSDDASYHPITVSMTCRNAYNRDCSQGFSPLTPFFAGLVQFPVDAAAHSTLLALS